MFRVRTQGFFELCEARTMIRTATSPSSVVLKPTVTRALAFSLPSTLVSAFIRNVRFSGGLPEERPVHDDPARGNSVIVPETNS